MRRGRATALGAVVGLALACTIWRPAGAEDATSTQLAESFIQSVGDRAVELLKSCGDENEALDQAGLGELIRSGFNIELIGRFVLGKYARKATPIQLSEYKRIYQEFFVGSYSRQLCTFRGEQVVVLGSQPVGSRDMMVDTRVDRDGQSLNASWRVRRSKGAYKIIDLMIDGVSMALSQRQEFSAIIVNGGVERLLEVLRNKLEVNAGAEDLAPAKGDVTAAGVAESRIESAVEAAPTSE